MSLKNIFDRIEFSSLFNRHRSTFYHYEKARFYNTTVIPKSDKLTFIWIPIALAIITVIGGALFTLETVNIALTCLSIFAGLLFSLLAIVLGIVNDNLKIILDDYHINDRNRVKAKIDLTQHLFINISFAIILSILAILFVLLTQFKVSILNSYLDQHEWYYTFCFALKYVTNIIAVFFIIEFMLTLFMIIKRFVVLYSNSIPEHSDQTPNQQNS